MRGVPPVALALGATVVLLGLLLAGFALFAPKGTTARCTAAQEAGPYGCVDFVSVSGTENGSPVDALAAGGLVYRVEKAGSGFRIVWGGGCNGGEADVSVSASRYRVGSPVLGQKACPTGQVPDSDAFAAALFDGTVQIEDRDDATVVLTKGSRSAVFAQTVVPKG